MSAVDSKSSPFRPFLFGAMVSHSGLATQARVVALEPVIIDGPFRRRSRSFFEQLLVTGIGTQFIIKLVYADSFN